MRIRKNLKLSSTSSSSSEDPTFHAHLCQLNQSPWDLIPFHSHSFYQFEYDDSSFTAATVTAANGDSIRAVDESSVASMMDIDEQAKLEDVAAIAMMELVDDNAKGSAKLMVTANNESSGGGATNRSYNKKPSPAAAAARGGSSRASNNKARAAGFKKPAAAATAPSTNPYEFYYYSGFGPSWSTKRRGDRSGREASKNNGIENSPALQRLDDSDDVLVSNITTSTSTATTIAPTTITDDVVVVGSDNNSTIEENVEGLDYELDLIDEEDCGDYGKKRMRKPVKARSLKSLM